MQTLLNRSGPLVKNALLCQLFSISTVEAPSKDFDPLHLTLVMVTFDPHDC